ncbi:transposase [Geobacillus stearothermophilus]|uniref:transposase n=3 Tax=Anoxybacillaceae TaxID=3120669 RepID=UPI003D2448FA
MHSSATVSQTSNAPCSTAFSANHWSNFARKTVKLLYGSQMILECHQKVNGIYGYYRVKAWIKRNYGKTVNHKRVYRLMKELGV